MSTPQNQDAAVLESLDFVPRCQSPHTPEHDAVLVMRHRCCGSTVIACEAHAAQVRSIFDRAMRAGDQWTCVSCGAAKPIGFHAGVELIPLHEVTS
ncbi:hypothetical protein [Microbacterium rhizophilus]|uniref:hypothetical protein n=1 Tax=Microbacterium rhizophilus TaxID=3138934 RepID=UPI0031E70BA7